MRFFALRQLDDPVRLGDVQAHRLLGEDVDAGLERGENHLRVQRVGRGHGHDIEVGKVAQDVQPRLRAGKRLRRVAGPAFEVLPGAPGGLLRARGHRHQLEFDWRQIPRPAVQSHAPELRADAGALQIGIGPRVHVPAEHARAHEGNLDCGVHRKAGQASRLSPVLLAPNVSREPGGRNPFQCGMRNAKARRIQRVRDFSGLWTLDFRL